jgi:N-acetyl-D-muramate 6-phosphate phosphatase
MLINTPKLILFDLDGTLCESLVGLRQVINELLNENNLPALTTDDLRGQVDKGSVEMIKFAFKLPANDNKIQPLRDALLQRYVSIMTETTEFFTGVEPVLEYLQKENIPWGVATNRPTFLAQPILEKFQFKQRAACLVFADSVKNPKPAPDMLLHACEITQVNPSDTIYIGDTENDMLAANKAKIPAIFASYGYLREESKDKPLQYIAKINHPLELIDLLRQTQTA